MANYNIDVNAKINVSKLKQSVQESLNATTINIHTGFTIDTNSQSLQRLKKTLASYFSQEPIPISFTLNSTTSDENIANINKALANKVNINAGINFDEKKLNDFITKSNEIKNYIKSIKEDTNVKFDYTVDAERYNQLNAVLNNIKKEEEKISNITIGIGFNDEQKKRFSYEITAIYLLLKGLENTGANTNITSLSNDNLSNLKMFYQMKKF